MSAKTEKEVKKVLISGVGMRDPYAETVNKTESKPQPFWRRLFGAQPPLSEDIVRTEGGVLTACRELQPDIVYLFPSSKALADKPDNQTEDRANQAVEIISSWEKHPECLVMPLKTDNASDLSKLYPCFRSNINKVMNDLAKRADNKEHWQDEYEIILLTSSGTQQMNHVARLVLANAPFEARYCSCLAPQFKKDGESRIKWDKPVTLEETTLLKRIDADVEGLYFHSVSDDCARLEDVSIYKPQKIMAGIIRKIFTAYEKMELLQYDEACNAIIPIMKLYRQEKDSLSERNSAVPFERISSILEAQAAFLSELKGQGELESTHNLVDLYFNMERAFKRGNYVDVLSRFWRLREGMMNFRLFSNCCLNRRALSAEFSEDVNKEREHEENLNLLQRSEYSDRVDWNKDYLKNEDGLRSLSDILCGLFKDHDLKRFENKFNNKFDNLRLVRNRTIVAHGMASVKQKDVEDCMTIGKEIIKLIPGGSELYKSYPFSLDNIREIVGLLKHV